MEKPTGGKLYRYKGGIPWNSSNPGQHLSASRHAEYIAMIHTNVEILGNGVKSGAPTFMPLGQLGQDNYTIMHQVS